LAIATLSRRIAVAKCERGARREKEKEKKEKGENSRESAMSASAPLYALVLQVQQDEEYRRDPATQESEYNGPP